MSNILAAQIERRRGDTVPDVIFLTDDVGDPLDVTGYTFKLTVNEDKDPIDDTNQLVQSIGSSGSPLTGRVDFPWTPLQADQTPGKYWYDIEQVDAGGKIKTLAKNKYIFYQDITKP